MQEIRHHVIELVDSISRDGPDITYITSKEKYSVMKLDIKPHRLTYYCRILQLHPPLLCMLALGKTGEGAYSQDSDIYM